MFFNFLRLRISVKFITKELWIIGPQCEGLGLIFFWKNIWEMSWLDQAGSSHAWSTKQQHPRSEESGRSHVSSFFSSVIVPNLVSTYRDTWIKNQYIWIRILFRIQVLFKTTDGEGKVFNFCLYEDTNGVESNFFYFVRIVCVFIMNLLTFECRNTLKEMSTL